MKVKIFASTLVDELEYAINKFIKDVKIIDIKYSSNKEGASAMIIYEEVL